MSPNAFRFLLADMVAATSALDNTMLKLGYAR
jgi:hypothetical protein